MAKRNRDFSTETTSSETEFEQLKLNEHTALAILGSAYARATSGELSKLPEELLQCSYIKDDKEHLIMSSPTGRHFFNFLGASAKRILEIGTYMGGSSVAFAYGNDNEVITIDNFAEPHGHDNVRERAVEHIAKCENVRLIEGDARVLDLSKLGKFDIIFLDGDHQFEPTETVLRRILPLMNDNCLIIMDDWSQVPVRAATYKVLDAYTGHKKLWTWDATGEMSRDPLSFWNHIACFMYHRPVAELGAKNED